MLGFLQEPSPLDAGERGKRIPVTIIYPTRRRNEEA